MAIQIADGFQLRVAKPLDDRQNVETVAQLDPTYGYEGQIVYVKDIKQFYTCYKDENGSLAYKVMETGSSTSNESAGIKLWVSGESYKENDFVSYNDYIYRCKIANNDTDFVEDNWQKQSDTHVGGASEAEFVSYDNESLPSVTNVEECLDAIIAKIYYVNPSITSFTCNPSRTAYEMGEKVTSVTFTWTYNKDMVSQTLTGCDLADETVRTATYSTEFNSNKTFTLSASDGTESATRSITISFRDKVYFGGASQPDTYDSAFVLGLGTANFATAKKGTYSMNVGAGQYGYLAIPTAFGAIDSVWIGGFEVTVDNCGAINFTNASGYTSSYTIYKTGQQGLGSITMEVK